MNLRAQVARKNVPPPAVFEDQSGIGANAFVDVIETRCRGRKSAAARADLIKQYSGCLIP